MSPIIRRTLTRDMRNGDRYVAHLEARIAENGERYVGGLSPSFSLTGELFEGRPNRSGARRHRHYVNRGGNVGPSAESDMSGAIGDDLARVMPQLAAFARMHLSDPETGERMHAEANGWYFYAGSRAGLRATERYNGFDAIHAWRLAEIGLTDDEAGRETYCYRLACEILRVDEIPRDLDREGFAQFVNAQRERWAREAAEARAFISALPAENDDKVAEILRTLNPTDPSGQWSIYDLSQKLPNLAESFIREAVARLCPDGGRYVGGTSGYLYHL